MAPSDRMYAEGIIGNFIRHLGNKVSVGQPPASKEN